MKFFRISRQAIFRSIRLASLALFLSALAEREANAQSVSAPFQVSGSTVTTQTGAYGNGAGLYEPGAGYSTFTIGAGTTINSTEFYGGNNLFNVDPDALVSTSASSFSNAGSLTLTTVNGTSSGSYQATVFLSQGATPITALNTGTIVSNLTGGNVQQALQIVSTTGSISLANSGTLSATGSNQPFGVALISTSGDITLTNAATGTISAGANGIAAEAGTTGAGTVNFSNSGSIVATGGFVGTFLSTATGEIQGSNSGVMTGATYGFAARSTTGTIQLSNTGTISAAVEGLSAQANSTGPVVLTNSGAGSIAVSSSATSTVSAIYGASAGAVTISNSGTGTVSATNSGTTGSGSAYGIFAKASGNISVTNSSSGLVSGSSTGVSTNGTGSAIYAESSTGSAYIKNSGAAASLSAGTGDAITLEAYGSTAVAINNSGPLTANANDNTGYASDIFTNGPTGAVTTVVNSGTGTSTGSYAYGISAYGATGGAVMVTNSGDLTSHGTFTGSGIYAGGDSAPVTVTNSAAVSGLGTGTSSGIYVNVENSGNVLITNTKTGSATGTTTATSGEILGGLGIYATTPGNVTVNNAGVASGTSAGAGTGSGIYVNAGGTALVNSTGTATGSTYGIYSAGAATVNDGGTVSGGVNSIYVASGSTVHLTGSSPLQGIIRGGSDDTSTSLLNFDLTVRTGYAQAKAALDAAIADYSAALATAGHGPGDDVTSEVVTINGNSYQWEDFLTVEDNLRQGRLYAQTPGFHSEGSVLDHLSTLSPRATSILNALGNLSDAELPAALAELSPKELELFRNVAFDNNTFNDQHIDNHLANLRDGLTGFDSSALTLHDSSMDANLAPIASHLLAYNPSATRGLISDTPESLFAGTDMKDAKSMVNTMPTDRWSSFIAGDVILADLNGDPNLQDSNYTTGSVTGGFDYRLDDHFTVGALLAYAHTDADLDQRNSSATVDSYSPGLYASYVDGGWYGNGLAAYTRNAYTDDRAIDIAGLSGNNHGGTSGNQGSVNLTGGYEFRKGSFKFGPVASIDYVHLNIDSIQEEGPTALSIGSQDQDSFRSRVGFEARFESAINTPIGPVVFNPHVSASWQHEYLDNSDGITSQFSGTGGGSFTTQTDSPDRDSGFFDGGLDATVCKNVTIFVDYEAQAGQDNFFAQSAQGGVKIGF
jgi:outer membrane autotransporter protein